MAQKPVKVYTPLMRYDKILFALLDVELPFPVTFRQIGFFFSSILGMFIVSHLPGLGFLQSYMLITYGLIPVALTLFFTKFKLDGKPPYIFILDYFLYQMKTGVFNRYEKIEEPDEYRYTSKITYRKGVDTE